jgi:hypothetical protein
MKHVFTLKLSRPLERGHVFPTHNAEIVIIGQIFCSRRNQHVLNGVGGHYIIAVGTNNGKELTKCFKHIMYHNVQWEREVHKDHYKKQTEKHNCKPSAIVSAVKSKTCIVVCDGM